MSKEPKESRSSDPSTGFIIQATGKYDQFIDPLIDSIIKYYQSPFTIYLFSDKEYIYHRNRVVNQLIDHEPWPTITLDRYFTFSYYKHLFSTDYLLYLDVDMLVENFFDINVIKGSIIATLHPGYFNKSNKPFCKDKKSRAYTPNGKYYFCGGVQGGERERYLEIAALLADNINEDKINEIQAEWHDESHWNQYLANNLPDRILNPQFCFVDNYNITGIPMIRALEKDHKELRKENKN